MRKLLWWLVPVVVVLILFGALVPVLFPRPCPVTRTAFDRIEEDMTKAEVEKILGGPAGDYTTKPVYSPVRSFMRPSGMVLKWEGNEGQVDVCFDGSEVVIWRTYHQATMLNAGPFETLKWRFNRWQARMFGTTP